MRCIRNIHLVGIGGVGMSGIAEVLLNLNYQVSGSDITKSPVTERLIKLGAQISYSHIPENVIHSDVVVLSSAIQPNNIEITTAKTLKIPVVARAEMLAELMRFKKGIAIAGTHGKTTTTSLIVSLFTEGEMDPTFIIGGQLNSTAMNAKLGTGTYFITEADESDASFLHLTPIISVLTNIDNDHLDTYNDDFTQLKKTFVEFIHQLPFYGLAVVCIDDQEIQNILSEITKPTITYGFSKKADVQITTFAQKHGQCHFHVILLDSNSPIDFFLNLPGKHNVLNAVAAIVVANKVGISIEIIQKVLLHFSGISRRFQQLGTFQLECGQIMMIDDYGHHPREIQSVIHAVRAGWEKKRLVMLFQPHRYTRTKALFRNFSSILSEVDVLIMLDVYAATEAPLPGADSRALCASIRNRGQIEPIFVENTDKLWTIVRNLLRDGDILITQGAGDIGKIAHHLVQHLKIAEKTTIV